MAKRPTPLLVVVVLLTLIAGASLYYATRVAPPPEGADAVLFRLGGQAFRRQDLPLKYGLPFQEAENNAYHIQQRILQAAIVDAYIDQQMRRSGDDRPTVIGRLFDQAPPTEETIAAFYQANRNHIDGTLEEAHDEISAYLQQLDRQQQQRELLAKLRSLKELSLHLPPPPTPAVDLDTAGYPAKGPEGARVTLVEFADYQCPHCKQAHEALKTELMPYLDRVRFVYMDFPINRSGVSRTVAEGAVCAHQQGRFWEYQNLAFERQAELDADSASALAQALKLDLTRFRRCLAAPQTAQRVQASERQAVRAGVTGTPTFFLNGRKLRLHDLEGSLTEQLDQALEALK